MENEKILDKRDFSWLNFATLILGPHLCEFCGDSVSPLRVFPGLPIFRCNITEARGEKISVQPRSGSGAQRKHCGRSKQVAQYRACLQAD